MTVDEEILDEIEIPQQENSTGNPEPTPVQKTATQEAKKTAIIWVNEDGDSAIYDYDVTADGLNEAGEINGDVFRGSWVGDSYYYVTDDDEYGYLCFTPEAVF